MTLTLHAMSGIRGLITLIAACVIQLGVSTGMAQTVEVRHLPGPGLLDARVTLPVDDSSPILNPQSAGADDDGDQHARKFRRRQAIILTGVAVSMLAYGLFTLQFNNKRTDSENARLAYEADVRENAQFYVDEGVPLDEIPTYRAWVQAYDDAFSARERLSIAGLSAFLLGIGAILDSATAGNRGSGDTRDQAVAPVIGVSPSSGDVLVGARVGF